MEEHHHKVRVTQLLIFDNGLQFNSKAFREYCSNLGIINWYLSPAYPYRNRQAKATNKTIVNGLKKRLEGVKGNWAEELPNILWAYRTTLKRSTGKIPFSMTYEAEAVIPIEISLSSIRVPYFSQSDNDTQMVKNLDFLGER